MDSALEGRYEITSLEHATVLAHYRAVMPRLAKHFGGTPVVYVTYPKQLGIDPVFHKGITNAPETIATVEVRTVTGAHAYVALNEHNLTWLVAGRFAIELCGWSPTPSDPDRCAFARIMLSPHGAAPDDLAVEGARMVRERLAGQGLQAIPMLTGFRGIALWIPFADAPPCSDVGHWAHEFAKELATTYPTVFTIENLHADRGDRVHLGTKSNFPGMGSLLPYALRGSPSLEVQVPLTWDELGTRRNGDVTAANFADYDATNGDAFEALTNAIGAQPFGSRAPKSSGRRPHLSVEVMDLSPHASILSAALAILADGQTRDAAAILAIAIERHLLPHSTTRKYVYTALHEYVERTLGAGRVPAIVQEERDGGAVFRLNRKPDAWPNVALPKLPSWLSDDDIATTVDRLTASATGGDPAAFELAVTHAFAALGFTARHVGGNAAPDVELDAPLGVLGYRAIVECKTAPPNGIVANPRAEEPARFRDAQAAKYALLVGPAFGRDAALDDELRAHGVTLWTVTDLATTVREQIGPAELETLLAPGRVAERLEALLWERLHGARKHVAVTAELLHHATWNAQRAFAGHVPPAETPIITDDSALLLVDQALEQAGVLDGATRNIVQRAIASLEVSGVLHRDAERGLCVFVPPPATG